MFSLDAGERWWSGKIGTRIWQDNWPAGAKARIGAARSGTAEQAAEQLDVALDFGWSSASALHNWRVFINGFSR